MMVLMFGGFGAALCVAGIALFLSRWTLLRRAVRTQGIIKELDVRSDSEVPIVTFEAPDARGSGAPRAFTFRSTSSQAGGYTIGQGVTVWYDPKDPTRATIMNRQALKLATAALLLSGVLFMAVAAGVAVFVLPGLARRDEAVTKFLGAYRSGDQRAVAAVTAPNAAIDEALLRSAVHASSSFVQGSSTLGGGESCVRGVLMPNRIEVILYLEEGSDGWKVLRAAKNDPACEKDLD